MIINDVPYKKSEFVTTDIDKIDVYVADLTDDTTYTIINGAVDSYKRTINS